MIELQARIIGSLRERDRCAIHMAAELGVPLEEVWPALVRLDDRGIATPSSLKHFVGGTLRARLWRLV